MKAVGDVIVNNLKDDLDNILAMAKERNIKGIGVKKITNKH